MARQKWREGAEGWRNNQVGLAKSSASCPAPLGAEERQILKAASDPKADREDFERGERHSLEAAPLEFGAGLDVNSLGVLTAAMGQVVPDQVTWKEALLIAALVKPVATHVAFRKKVGLFPLPCLLPDFFTDGWPAGGFCADHCAQAWICLAAAALNHLHGEKPPFPKHRGGVTVKKAMDTLSSRVVRFLSQSVGTPTAAGGIWKEVKEKSVNYNGEEVALAQPLTVDQILPSLPPVGHGGSVELSPLLVGRSRFLLEHPEQVLLKSDRIKPGKNRSKVHIAEGNEIGIFHLLFKRGVIDFIPEQDVYSDENGPFLSGLFGVPKPGKVSAQGNQVLRLIMNLIPINRALDVVLGDIQELPSAATWQQLVLFEGSSITISQADMSSAFYLFRLPPVWLKFLAFNFRLKRKDVGLPGEGFVYPACRVLPMGWSSWCFLASAI